MNYHLIDMQVHGDRRGKLISLEGLKNVPFEIKRIYYMFDTLPNEARGFHAHKELEQVIIAMDGAYDAHGGGVHGVQPLQVVHKGVAVCL